MDKETVVYKGFKFTRYPNAKGISERRYYSGWIKKDGKQIKKRLHVFVWEWNNGKTPAGYHIHHIDGDFNNNKLSNLGCIKGFDHLSNHAKNASDEVKRIRLQALEDNRDKAAEWHGSEAGHLWHSEHFKHTIGCNEIAFCKECGKEFTKKVKRAEFCSVRCKNRFCSQAARHRYKNVPKYAICEVCGKSFKPIQNNAGRFCSQQCYQTSRKSL